MGGIASSHPSLPPSLLLIQEAAARALAPAAAPGAPPHCHPQHGLVPARGEPWPFRLARVEVWGGSWWVRLAGTLCFLSLTFTEVQGGAFWPFRLWSVPLGPPVSSSWKKSGCFTCPSEHTFLRHYSQCQAQGKVQKELQVASGLVTFFSFPF